MAAAAMTPRSLETRLSPANFPGVSFIRPPGEHSKALIVNHAKAQTIRTDLIGIGYTFPTARRKVLHERRRPYELSSPRPSRNTAEVPRPGLADNSFHGISVRIDRCLGRVREIGEKANSVE